MAIIVIAGAITTGFKHYGPFPNWDAASNFSEGRECIDCEWWIVELIAPFGQETPAMLAALRDIGRDDDGDGMIDAVGMDRIEAILARIDGEG